MKVPLLFFEESYFRVCVFVLERPGEALHSRSNTDKIKEVLQWNYKIKVIDWIKSKFN